MNEKLKDLKHELSAEDDSASYCCEAAEALPIEQVPELNEEVFE
uniref:Uncharacterized protein n=1 Tax=Candidatus Kentrum eta TaxID=2126337 RepID=A0A450VH26_9GAMM|nr:MAG: hypothetical protein BECKH772A_GA0070896_101646 [Candidatus Kentron sp. H]VFJ99782.1 MAG: hypothetical protein BECKH772B_GA0070898_101686 [Candidatus Kentron sp. H]VFK04116.1 MAG: hypothetical protein BECKH772C_GA0070978_101626 [Candidatus Kentron sp. H]